jgi:uncharacterized membrane protein
MLTCEPSDQVVLGTGIYRGTGGSAHSPDVSPRTRWVPIITLLPVTVERCFARGACPRATATTMSSSLSGKVARRQRQGTVKPFSP